MGEIVPSLKRPDSYRFEAVREGGQSTVVSIAPRMRRIEMRLDGRLTSIVIGRWDQSRLLQFDVSTGVANEHPLHEPESLDPHASMLWRVAGNVEIDNVLYDRYELLDPQNVNTIKEIVLVDPTTKFPFRVQTLDKRGRVGATIEMRNVYIGPLAVSLFERP